MTARGKRERKAPWTGGRMTVLMLGILALIVGLGLYLWRGRPMLFGLIVGIAAVVWCLLWALIPSRGLHGVLLGLIAAAIVGFGVLEGVILSWQEGKITGQPEAMVVLGAAVWDYGPSPMLSARLETALSYWNQHPEMVIVVSGGQGSNEPESEADAMAEYLITRGVPEEQILLEDQAYNTVENLKFSAAILEEAGISTENLLVVSNGFHLCRVELLADRLGLEISTLSAPTPGSMATKVYFYARESLGLVKSWALDR